MLFRANGNKKKKKKTKNGTQEINYKLDEKERQHFW